MDVMTIEILMNVGDVGMGIGWITLSEDVKKWGENNGEYRLCTREGK